MENHEVPSGHGTLREERRCPRLLIVEDHDDTRLLLETLLTEQYEAVVYAKGAEALAAARRAVEEDRPFEGALLDISLGGGETGVDVLRALRGLDAYGAIPVVATTAFVLPGDHERFLQAGFDDYLPKPFLPEELEGMLAGMFQS